MCTLHNTAVENNTDTDHDNFQYNYLQSDSKDNKISRLQENRVSVLLKKKMNLSHILLAIFKLF